MKQVGGLFWRIWDPVHLVDAAHRAARGKADRVEVRQFLAALSSEVRQISEGLQSGSWRFGGYRQFQIRDPKTRTIHAPPFRDRVVHHAIMSATGPTFERGAIRSSHACRKGRGLDAALRDVRVWVRTGDWFLKADIARYYDSVDHLILRDLLGRRFRERRLLALFEQLLESYSVTNGKGLPLGALTSQYFGNFFLDPFDHHVLETLRMPRYVRYMDDMVFLGTRAEVLRARDEGVRWLADVGLSWKGGGCINRAELGIPFLGFTVYPDRLRLNASGRRRLRRRWHAVERDFVRHPVTPVQLQARATALFAHAMRGDDVRWRQTVCRFSRFGEAQGPRPRDPRRLVEQFGQEVPVREPQQEEAR